MQLLLKPTTNLFSLINRKQNKHFILVFIIKDLFLACHRFVFAVEGRWKSDQGHCDYLLHVLMTTLPQCSYCCISLLTQITVIFEWGFMLLLLLIGVWKLWIIILNEIPVCFSSLTLILVYRVVITLRMLISWESTVQLFHKHISDITSKWLMFQHKNKIKLNCWNVTNTIV